MPSIDFIELTKMNIVKRTRQMLSFLGTKGDAAPPTAAMPEQVNPSVHLSPVKTHFEGKGSSWTQLHAPLEVVKTVS